MYQRQILTPGARAASNPIYAFRILGLKFPICGIPALWEFMFNKIISKITSVPKDPSTPEVSHTSGVTPCNISRSLLPLKEELWFHCLKSAAQQGRVVPLTPQKIFHEYEMYHPSGFHWSCSFKTHIKFPGSILNSFHVKILWHWSNRQLPP